MMRITNSMMTANTKSNLNINKVNSDTLNTMVASGQKITRPSDDPVVAIRAMRLNTSLTELDQYYGKNIPDADAWFTDTETALSQTDDVLSSIREKLNQASSQENVTSNVNDILEELKQLKAQFYSIGNADSAGRTVFTGYRTGEMLTFMESDKLKYVIDEPLKIDDLEVTNYIKGGRDINVKGEALKADNSGNEDTSFKESDIESVKTYRLRLAYSNLDDVKSISYTDENGASKTINFDVVQLSGKSRSEIDDIYTADDGAKSKAISDTGEIILSKTDYEALIKGSNITVVYEKENWEKGDPRPEHYFKCNTPRDDNDPRTYSATYPGSDGIEYNFNREKSDTDHTAVTSGGVITGFKEQELTYEISFNQSIKINTHANDVYSHDIGRDIDDLISITGQVSDVEKRISDIENCIASAEDEETIAKLNKNLEAFTKERTLLREKMHDMYTSAITSFKGYSDDINKQISSLGALTARLEMTKNRVKDQQTNVKILADENINADLSETAIDFKNAQLALEAAQMAAGKIANQTLLNFI